MSNTHLSETRFDSLQIPDEVLQGLAAAGLEHCTPIQDETLPHVLAGHDVAGQAQTGTGKTAAFLIATFNSLIRDPASAARQPNQPRALVLAPTRELAIQIHKDALQLGKYSGFRIGLAYGGTGYEQQRQSIAAGVDILIGTPGRLIDYFKQRVYDLREIQVAILDEADRMFDLGFISDVRYMFRHMPPPTKRLSMLFSATLSYRVLELAYEHMNNPETVRIEPDRVTADKVQQVVYHPASNEKIPLLIGLLQHMDPRRTLVFVNTKRAAEQVCAYLRANGFDAEALSGDVPQPKRQRLLARFHHGELPILIATDVAARGLHIPDVTHVFNYDLPQHAEDYVHRIGRTARAGQSGDAVSFVCEEFAFSLPEIETYIGHKIEMAPITENFLVKPERPASIRRRPRKATPQRSPNPRRKSRNRTQPARKTTAAAS